MWSVHIVGFHVSIKNRNHIDWEKVDGTVVTVLSKESQIQKDKKHIFLFVCGT